MYHLATVFPRLKHIRLPFTRDQLLLFMLAINEIILGVDIFLAHSISGTIVPYEWIPIIFGPVAGVILLVAGLLAYRNRALATVLAMVTFIASILVGVLGTHFHLLRAALPSAGLGNIFSFDMFVWAPPLFGPASFIGIGIIGLIAAWIEEPVDSGTLVVSKNRKLQLRYPKSNIYFFLIGLGMLATVVSSVIDHARTGFHNPWLWLPTAVGIFAVVVMIVVGDVEEDPRSEIIIYLIAMVIMILVGLLGTYFHIRSDLTADFQIVQERFLRGAPFLAPLNFANMAILGLIALLDPHEKLTR